MRVAFAADHAGWPLRARILAELLTLGHAVVDRGSQQLDPEDDYPDRADAVASSIVNGEAERGILVCGSGVGAAVAASKVPGVRACLCHDSFSARQGVEDDDLNVLCLGARIVGEELAVDLVRGFLAARFSGAERHRRRLAKIAEIESRLRKPPR